MKIVIELPTWLGDCIMATPAISNIISNYKDPTVILIGSKASLSVFADHPSVSKSYTLDRDFFSIFSLSKNIRKNDLFISFRGSMRSKLLRFLSSCKESYQFNKIKFSQGHQVEKYNNFINHSLGLSKVANDLSIFAKLKRNNKYKNAIGINPGAAYGSAKRWNPEKFAEVAEYFSKDYNIIIFGGTNEVDIGKQIESALVKKKVHNIYNLSGRTSLVELFSLIKDLKLFITGDSGPMHIAAAYKVPTVSIFGPTDQSKTCQWKNPHGTIVNLSLDCQPCMKRVCPLRHHQCMKNISPRLVIDSALELVN